VFRRPSFHVAALAAAVSFEALMFAGPALAQNVQMFDQAPSIEELRKILIPETRPGGLSRRIEIPRRDSIAGAPMIQPAAAQMDGAGSAPTSLAPATSAPTTPAQAAMEVPTPVPVPAAPRPAATQAAAAVQPESGVPTSKAGIVDAVGFRINFALNSAIVPPAYESYIDRVGELMRQEPDLALLVEGHTDASGSDRYNDELSERRAVAVARYLVVRHGIDPERLRVVGKGKSEPLLKDPYDPRNRRVQFLRTE
jgi:OmpA-OmpF porin, OOP family